MIRFLSGWGRIILLLIYLFIYGRSFATIKTWNGSAGDGFWLTAANWNDGSLPAPGDDVVLDNISVPGDYMVVLPDSKVVVRTLTISPAAGHHIRLVLPSGNIIDSAFSVMGPGYGLVIDDGGIFENASGLSGGESLGIADSIRINNGGRYIHHTRAAHANNIARLLSTAPGTERGIFEFDVPRSAYTISASGRTYGSLVLSAGVANGINTYTCNGTNPLTINGDWIINDSVNVNIDLRSANGNILLKGNFIQNGGSFNIGSGAGNTTVVKITGDLLQSASSVITAASTAFPVIEICGSTLQHISLPGAITNNVVFRMNNSAGAQLMAPLTLPYRLELLQGKITSSATDLLTLQSACSILADSTISNTSFVEGPICKQGLMNTDHFLFPVGHDSLRWAELKNATGSFTVEYIKADPHLLGNDHAAGIDHISSVEYWSIRADSSHPATGSVELSFAVPGSGGISNPLFLNIASLSSGLWSDAGHTGVTGISNSRGSVISDLQDSFPAVDYFTFASTSVAENTLPVTLIDFSGRVDDGITVLAWQVDLPGEADHFEVMEQQGNDFRVIGRVPAQNGQARYLFTAGQETSSARYYRLRVTDKEGASYLSQIVTVGNMPAALSIKMAPSPVIGNRAMLMVNSPREENMQWLIVAMNGSVVRSGYAKIQVGNNRFWIDLSRLSAGFFQLISVDDRNQFRTLSFIKQ